MPPVIVASSRSASALETGAAKLWMLLIGVNHYQDATLPPLRYAAVDCQGIGAALTAATQQFPHKDLAIFHDLATELPTLATVTASLRRVVSEARSQDTVAIYFSGHGVVEPIARQTVLCLRDTDASDLSNTGLPIQSVLQQLHACAAQDRLLWLDACHSGNLSLTAAATDRQVTLLNPSWQLIESLRQGVSQQRGFYALLSCDEGQHAWEFPDLGHGVFSYYLMLGLRGEAADARGVIAADGLYHYVYRQTVSYINTLNQQLRLSARERRERGEICWFPEYSPQTPKRIVSGVGEIVLGLEPRAKIEREDRTALILAATADPTVEMFGGVLTQEGNFTLAELPPLDSAAVVCERIQTFLIADPDLVSTRLLYLRGQLVDRDDGAAGLEIAPEVYLSRAWLGQVLQRHRQVRQIIILDCLSTNTRQSDRAAATEWVMALANTAATEAAQIDLQSCSLLIGVAPPATAELFIQVLLEATIAMPVDMSAEIERFLATVQTNLATLGIAAQCWFDERATQLEARRGSIAATLVPTVVESPSPSIAETAEPAAADPELTFGQVETQLQPQLGSSTAAFSQNLASILHQLVGPIAPALLQQVDLDLHADPTLAIVRLLPLLPERDRDPFVRQVRMLAQQQPAALAPISAPTPTPPSAHPATRETTPAVAAQQRHLTAVARPEIERTLRGIVGPVAGILLGQLAPTAWQTIEDLIAALTPDLNRDLLAEFDRQLQRLLASATTVAAPASEERSGNQRGNELIALDDRFKLACERELMRALGPIATYIVATTATAHPRATTTEFVTLLAAQIPDSTQAEAFRRKMTAPG